MKYLNRFVRLFYCCGMPKSIKKFYIFFSKTRKSNSASLKIRIHAYKIPRIPKNETNNVTKIMWIIAVKNAIKIQ